MELTPYQKKISAILNDCRPESILHLMQHFRQSDDKEAFVTVLAAELVAAKLKNGAESK